MRSQSTGRSGEAPPAPEPLAVAVLDSHTHFDLQDGIAQPGGADEAGRSQQHASFRAHIDIAKRHGKALVIHDRDAHDDVLKLLEEEGAPETVVLHCFSGDAEFARQCADRGYVMSFAGTVTFRNAVPLQEVAKVAPRELILVETDAPFLTPMPYRGRPNAPYLIPLTVRFLADLRGDDLDELCAVISATGERVFGPW